ncbi:MAG TPA: hypothetical protein VFN08_07540, partial [Gemmatimonadales bacterium]|nr:hypothetical protein [Gemmatimonadales bacterium]
MHRINLSLSGLALAAAATVVTACADTPSGPSSSPAVESQSPALATTATPAAVGATIRLRCERRSNRSRISVDASGLVPSTGRFRARVTAAGGTATSPLKRAVAGQDEFDFDSNPNDVRAGATQISA